MFDFRPDPEMCLFRPSPPEPPDEAEQGFVETASLAEQTIPEDKRYNWYHRRVFRIAQILAVCSVWHVDQIRQLRRCLEADARPPRAPRLHAPNPFHGDHECERELGQVLFLLSKLGGDYLGGWLTAVGYAHRYPAMRGAAFKTRDSGQPLRLVKQA
ncbi:MAG: hypothetical protein KAY37_03655 [Phycisphaerae bacterium]|nr:hypothetical protein [Phycisphaerae bacterium]